MSHPLVAYEAERKRQLRHTQLPPSKPAFVQRQLAEIPLFAGCSKRELRAVAKAAVIEQRATGATLVTQGSTGTDMFVLLQGQCRVVRNGRKVAQIGPGAVVGELSLLAKAVRNATVVGEAPLEVAVLGRRQFYDVLEQSPTITRKLLERLAARVQELDARALT